MISKIVSAGRIACAIVRNKVSPDTPNLLGDRDIEWTWICANVPPGEGRALDFGGAGTNVALAAAHMGWEVTTLDLQYAPPRYCEHPRVHGEQGDILTAELPPGGFGLVLNCSTVEHVGLSGRYGTEVAENDGDLQAMGKLREALAPGGVMIMTIPVGRDAVIVPLHRVYGHDRLPRLLSGYELRRECFFVKNAANRWVPAKRDTALDAVAHSRSKDAFRNYYALGCFVLQRPAAGRNGEGG